MKTEHVEYLSYLGRKMVEFIEIKALCGVVWASLVYLFGTGQTEAILALFLLVIVDWVFGVAAAKKTGEQITSAKFLRSPIKLGIYFTLIAATHISEHALPEILGVLDETMTAGLVITELLSVFEKSGKLGYAVPQRVLNQIEIYKNGGALSSSK